MAAAPLLPERQILVGRLGRVRRLAGGEGAEPGDQPIDGGGQRCRRARIEAEPRDHPGRAPLEVRRYRLRQPRLVAEAQPGRRSRRRSSAAAHRSAIPADGARLPATARTGCRRRRARRSRRPAARPALPGCAPPPPPTAAAPSARARGRRRSIPRTRRVRPGACRRRARAAACAPPNARPAPAIRRARLRRARSCA